MREALQSLLGLSAPDLFDETRKHSRNLALAQWEVAACLLAIEQSRAHSEAGFSSVCQCAEVRWGIASHTAAEMVRVARVLVTFPHLSAAIRDGQINWTKAREITRVVTLESEASWVKFARSHTTREVERRVVKSPRQWKKEQGTPGNPHGSGTGQSQHNAHRESAAAPGSSRGSGHEGSLPRRDVETTGKPDETRGGEGRPTPEEPPPGGGAPAPGRSPGSPVVEEQDLFGNPADGASREQTDVGPCSERLGDEVSGAERRPVGRPTPAPTHGSDEEVGPEKQPPSTPSPSDGPDEEVGPEKQSPFARTPGDGPDEEVGPEEQPPSTPSPSDGPDEEVGPEKQPPSTPSPSDGPDEEVGPEKQPPFAPTPGDGPAEEVGPEEQPSLTPVPPSHGGDAGAIGESSEGASESGHQQEPDDAEDLGPDVPPELQRVGLRFLLTGVQLRTFELAATALKTRNRSLRRREDVLEEMCRMVLAGVGSSTSSRVRSTLVVYRDPATGADWVETDRGPLRVAREDLERVAAEGEVVHVARPEAEAGLPSEILERTLAPRSSRQDIQGILAPLPLAPARAPHAPVEPLGAAVQESPLQGGADSPEERVGAVAGASEQAPHLRLQADFLGEAPHPCPPGTEQPPHLRLQGDFLGEAPHPFPASAEQPSPTRSRPSALAQSTEQPSPTRSRPSALAQSAEQPSPTRSRPSALAQSAEQPSPTRSRPSALAQSAEPPSPTRSRLSALGQETPLHPAVSDGPSGNGNGTAGGVVIPKLHGPCSCSHGSGGRRAPIPAATYRKLWVRSGGRCENPGCGRGGPLHVHHDDAWSDEHHHDPDRMRLLCERCHALLHEDDFATRQDWASARAWRMSRSGSSSPARDAGPSDPPARQVERLPRPGSRG